jgi:hypothetical protein
MKASTALRNFSTPTSALFLRWPALERKRLGDNRNRKRARRLGDVGDDGCGAGSRATAHARGDEDEVALGERVDNFIARLLGGAVADFGVAAGAETRRDGVADLNFLVGVRESSACLSVLMAIIQHRTSRFRSCG